MSMEEFQRSKAAEMAAAEGEAEVGPAFYALDSHGVPHFAKSREDALKAVSEANASYN